MKFSKIKNYKGRGNELITLYISSDNSVSNVQSIIDQELKSLEDYDEGTRMKYSVRDSLNSIKDKVSKFETIPRKGMIIFAGRVEGDTMCEVFTEQIQSEVKSTRYVTGSQFSTDKAESLISTEESQVVAVLDTGKMILGEYQGSVRVLDELNENIPSKHSKGGQSQARFERRRSEYKKEFFRTCSKRILNHASDEDTVFIGGPEMTLKEFMNSTNIDSSIELVTVTTEYVNEVGLRRVSETVTEHIGRKNRRKRTEAVESFMRSIKNEESLTEYGFENVKKAVEYGAVDKLIVQEGKFSNIVQQAESMGASIVQIKNETDKEKTFIEAFDGIGAILNYRIR